MFRSTTPSQQIKNDGNGEMEGMETRSSVSLSPVCGLH